MVEYILGNYLVEVGKITKEQLHNVLKKMEYYDAEIAAKAVERGILTREQTEILKAMQTAENLSFEDIALNKGYLRHDQLAKINYQKKDAFVSFTEILESEGLVKAEELEWLLAEFKNANGYDDAQMEDIKSDEVDRIVPLLLPEEGKIYKELVSAAIRTLSHKIDRNIYIGRACMVDSFPGSLYVCQAVAWEKGIVDFFSERDGALLKLAGRYGHDVYDRVDSDSLDAAGEFLNCINGVYASGQSRDGEFYELMPPLQNECNENVRKDSFCRIPVFIGDCGLYLTVAELL